MATRHRALISADCLIVVDVQNGFINEATSGIPARIRTLLDSVHFKHRIFTRFLNAPGSQFEKLMNWTKVRTNPETDIVDELREYPTFVVEKNYYSAVTPDFLHHVHTHEINSFYLVGIDTDICVLKTAVDLFEQGFTPYVLTDCCMSHAGPILHEAALKILPRFIGHQQIITNSMAHFGVEAALR